MAGSPVVPGHGTRELRAVAAGADGCFRAVANQGLDEPGHFALERVEQLADWRKILVAAQFFHAGSGRGCRRSTHVGRQALEAVPGPLDALRITCLDGDFES